VWLLGLSLWLLGHSVHAQLGAALAPEARWRSDDPDLVRPGLHATPAAALAEGATVLHVEQVDVDDTYESLVMQVAPRADPSPMNFHSGTVLLVHMPRGWHGEVLVREDLQWRQRESVIAGWSVVRDRGRRELILRFVHSSGAENYSGHGHHLFRQDQRQRVRRVAGMVRLDACVAEHDDETGDVPWYIPDSQGNARRPVPRWCRARAQTDWRPPPHPDM